MKAHRILCIYNGPDSVHTPWYFQRIRFNKQPVFDTDRDKAHQYVSNIPEVLVKDFMRVVKALDEKTCDLYTFCIQSQEPPDPWVIEVPE